MKMKCINCCTIVEINEKDLTKKELEEADASELWVKCPRCGERHVFLKVFDDKVKAEYKIGKFLWQTRRT